MQLPTARPSAPPSAIRRTTSLRVSRTRLPADPPATDATIVETPDAAPDAPIRVVRLPGRFYLRRAVAEGVEVRDVMPWPDAVEYVTDGTLLGMRMRDGRVLWITANQRAQLPLFREEFADVDVQALLNGLRRYIRRYPRLKYLWQEDLAALEDLVAELEELHTR